MKAQFANARDIRDYLSTLAFNGLCYESAWNVETITAGTAVYAEITTSPTKYTLYNYREVMSDKDRLFFTNFTDYTLTSVDDAVTVYSLKLDTAYPSQVVFNNVTPNTINQQSKGAVVPVFGDPSGGSKSTGNAKEDGAIRIIPPNSKFLICLDNQSTNDCYAQLVLRWCEVSVEYMNQAQEL